MSIVHSSEETHSVMRVIGGAPGSGSARHAASPAAATARATGSGSSPSGASRPWVASSLVTNSRNTTGSPSVTKYAAPPAPFVAPSHRPSATLSTCVVEVLWRPPPIQRNWTLFTAFTSDGTIVVSPGPHTKRGRTTTVSNSPGRLACRTACSARAFVEGYKDGESGRSGRLSSAFTSGCPASSAASVPTCTKRLTPAAAVPASTLWVPATLSRPKSARGPHYPACAAAWNAYSHPCAPSRMASTSEISPLTGSAPRARTVSAERSERASARTLQPSASSLSMRRPPMKPEPPVTKALPATRRTLRLHLECDPLDRHAADRLDCERVGPCRQLGGLEAQRVGAGLARPGEGGANLALAQHGQLDLRLARELVAHERALLDGEDARLQLERREL